VFLIFRIVSVFIKTSSDFQQADNTVASFIEAMTRVAMRREDGGFVTQILQAYRSIDDKTFSAADAKIWVEEDDVLLSRRHDRCLRDISS